MDRRLRFCFSSFLALALSACGFAEGEDDVDIAFIGNPGDVRQTGVRLSPAAQHVREATAEGLVAFDANGDVVPALAERWIVTDDGLSYIFRLRDSTWPDGQAVTAGSVKREFDRALAAVDGTSLGYDIDIIADVRAMAGRVVEIRLKHPMAEFLALLAQPELGLLQRDRGMGPMRAAEEGGLVTLATIPPAQRGLPSIEYWEESVRPVKLRAYDAAAAVKAFEQGDADVVLGGRIQSLPLADLGPLSRGTIRVDPVVGLLGLQVLRTEGLLEASAQREALAMAIDRGELFETLNLGQWQPSTRIVPYLAGVDDAVPNERWAALAIDQRQTEAARRIAAWQSASGKPARLAIVLPEGPGSDRVFGALAEDFGKIGVTLVRVEKAADADLALFDRVARYADRRWFLNQFNCRVARLLCSRDADLAVIASLIEADPAERAKLLAEAEAILLDRNTYIPLGTPIRWSLVRSGVDGFEANRTGFHPLFPLAMRPI
ncbi:MAG: peptide ABC transporter substrate-binding protein [Altererythrobacter sp.]|nr:peptide ABC transporter substrate-binding protein [Altererythrobacter sp.]